MAKQKQEPEPKEEREEPERLSHYQAAHRVVRGIDGDTTLSELAEAADRLVTEGGGKANHERAWNACAAVLNSLEELGLVELNQEVTVHPLVKLNELAGGK